MTPDTMDEAERLRASRARLIAAGNKERRRIERTLHDGIQQHLVALAVKLRLVRDLIPDQPEEAQAILDQLTGEIREGLQELRNLAHRVYPALLVDGGLPDALGVAASRARATATVATARLRRYDPDIEAGIYFAIAEALSALGEDDHAHISVTEDDGTITFDVVTEGEGFAGDYPTSEEFALLADRIEAIGGTVEVQPSAAGGSRLRGRVSASAGTAIA